MKKIFTLLISTIITLFLCLEISPTAWAADGDYTYVDENGAAKTTEGLTVTPVAADTSTLSGGWYVVNSDVTRSSTITVSGDVKLILVDGFTLTITGGYKNAGINVSPGNSLTIYGQAGGTGSVIAQGGQYGAGIGGGYWSSGGTVSICGGTVSATGGQDAAGIGGGQGVSGSDNSNGGTINIYGGSVTATGNGYGAGIGGGLQGTGGIITIKNGTVHATSGDSSITGAAGIGGGVGKAGTKITITGGVVVARSLYRGAGIGGGAGGNGGTIEISGGNITASSHYRGAGIGGGDMKDGGTITIKGGTVNAYSEDSGAGIGGGCLASGGTTSIKGGDITATGGIWSAGIGGGCNGSGGSITISGGVVKAYAGDYGAGIGAGGYNTASSQSGGTIVISGGQVTAKGGSSGMDAGLDIGRGRNGVNGTVAIDNTAQVTLASNGVDTSVTTLGTCILQGSAAGSILGAYESGTKIDGTLIDLSDPSLSNGTGYTVSGNNVTLIGSGNKYVLFNSTASRNIIVSSGASASVALFTANIKPASGCAFDMAGATVNLRLVVANSFYSKDGYAGLQASTGSSLTVSGSGSLTAKGGNDGAGIGGDAGVPAGIITFSGGTVNAVGVGGGAGIGGGRGGAGGTVLADGENTVVAATGGETGYDIGSGDGNSSGGSLKIQNSATINMNLNGTNANASFITGTIGGTGAGILAGTYLNSKKLLSISGLTASPVSGTKAFDSVTLTANVTGLSVTDAQGKIAFFSDGTKIGQASLERSADGSADATAVFVWMSSGGTHTFTAQYVQNETTDSYYAAAAGELNGYEVSRIDQSSISVGGIPDTITYGDPSFVLIGGDGNGEGSFSYSVKSGDAVSVSGGTVSVRKAGTAQITAIKAGDANYLPVSIDVTITVNKATPPSVVFPSAGTITYGQALSDSALTGGSGDGGFSWESPNTKPTVINSGYNVVFTPNDTNNYDYTGFVLTQKVSISVNKATPVVTFPTAGGITYEQSLANSALTGGSGQGNFAWENPAVIPTVINSGYNVIFTPNDTDNYLSVSQKVSVSVQKAEQAALLVSGIPDTVTYGGAPFDMVGSGGSGEGSFSYSVKSGDAISVSGSTVSVLKAGISRITATKSGDTNYLTASTDVTITVKKAAPPSIVFPSAGTITYGQALSASLLTGGSGSGGFAWEDPSTVPTVINSGYNVVFTPSDTDNYMTVKQSVALIVNKAYQAPLTVGGIPGTLTYGDAPFQLTVSGGCGTGPLTYAVIADNAVIVDSYGKITVIHAGTSMIRITNTGDDNYLPISCTDVITVAKAKQTDLSFTVPDSVAYGDVPFNIGGKGGNGSGEFSYAVTSGDAVDVSAAGIVTVLRPGNAVISATKAGDCDYLSQTQTIQICAGKGTQKALSVSGIPRRVTTAQSNFMLIVSGGSGTGELSYVVTSGKSISVGVNGAVTILRPGKAVLMVSKAADDYYNAITTSVEISVVEATPAEDETPSDSPTSSATPLPSVAPTPSAIPTPSQAAAKESFSPTDSPAAVILDPISIQTDKQTGITSVSINIRDLPKDTAAIKLPSGKIVKIVTNADIFKIQINQEDLDENGDCVILALSAEDIPLGNYCVDLSKNSWKDSMGNKSHDYITILIWIIVGVLAAGGAAAAAVILSKKKRKNIV